MTMPQTDIIENPESQVDEDQQSFADQCISLLCRQEKALWLLGERGRGDAAKESLDLASRMLVQFVDFAEIYFSESESADIRVPLSRVSECGKHHERQLSKWSWRLVRRLVGLESPSDQELEQSYQELGKAYEDLFRAFFEICEKRLSPESAATELFSQSVETFLRELKEKW